MCVPGVSLSPYAQAEIDSLKAQLEKAEGVLETLADPNGSPPIGAAVNYFVSRALDYRNKVGGATK